MFSIRFTAACAVIAMALLALMPLKSAAGTWTALTTAPPVSVNEALVLSDGTILTDNGNGQCARLTPDIHGSYVNGTWTQLSSMNYSRLFFSTELLTNGTVFVAGGEYGNGTDHGEIFDPLRNTWTRIYPDPIPAVAFSDAISAMLPDGNVLDAPVSEFGGILIYNVASNSYQTAASTANQNEVCWVELQSGCILTINTASENVDHYVPSLNEWVTDDTLPVPLYDSIAELGPGFLLPNGNVFYFGATTNTAIYTPGSTVTSAGTWTVGPPMVFGANFLGMVDAPAAMLTDGNILCALGPVGGFNSPTFFYEYNYLANTFTQENAPGGGTSINTPPFTTSMLDLPDGNVLLVDGQNTTALYVYTPSGTPLAAGQPAIDSITENADGSYQLTGTGLTGISAGAAYGDDEQMNSNYPLVRMTNNATGDVYYARTFNWNSTAVQTGSAVITTEFTLPQNLPAGTYSLAVEANGNPSAPTAFSYSPPSVPTGLAGTSGSNGFVNLTWNASAGATAYNVKRCSSVNGYYGTLATVTGLSYTNFGVTNGLTYYYKVAAIGSGGPSSDSAAAAATPAGPKLIPSATQVSLSGNYNRSGIFTDGHTFTTGYDGGTHALSSTLLGISLWWNNLVFDFGPSNANDVVYCSGQTITLPAGQFNTLQILGSAVNGAQASQTFTVTYTDNTTSTFTQNFSDWATPQSYPEEFTVMTMPYRDTSSGGEQTLNVNVYGYVFVLNQTKTVKSITLPNDSDVVIMAMTLANDSAQVPLSAYCNRPGIYADGVTFSNPATGGLDGDGNAYSATLTGNSLTWSNSLFAFGPFSATNVISCTGQTVTLPPGNYAQCQILATAVNGAQTSQAFTIAYTNSTQTEFIQNLSDWGSPGNYAGESKALIMSYRNQANGNGDTETFYLYGYSFKLNPARTVQSFKLPNDTNVVVTAISLVPEWPPTFTTNPLTLPGADAGQAYSANIATNASDLNDDALTFALVSGPSWLTVASSGALSGTPANTNANTNTFLISATDTGGLSSTDTVYISVTGAPYFLVKPFTMPSILAGQNYSGAIATNATDPNTGDTPVFSLVSGPSWLSVASNGGLSGQPQLANAGTNAFTVSVTDQGGLSSSATMYILVTAPPILPKISQQSGVLTLTWSGGLGPYQLQMTTNLSNPTWQDVGSPISGTNVLITPSNSAAFYRIVGQ
ncbi:MAG TPA: putative Ig domain-containing protein [Candidatus Sulfotelmatobacter sp.]|nr:putative Ig domain-containing protein [Candidatus Sulfotelmatobacter sp.]